MTDNDIRTILENVKTIAAVGLSNTKGRASGSVCHYLQSHGYRVIPVNPNESEVSGEKAYASLKDVPDEVDLVLVFRKPAHVPQVVQEAIGHTEARYVWMQDGAGSEEAADAAREAGLVVVVNDCMLRQHARLLG